MTVYTEKQTKKMRANESAAHRKAALFTWKYSLCFLLFLRCEHSPLLPQTIQSLPRMGKSEESTGPSAVDEPAEP